MVRNQLPAQVVRATFLWNKAILISKIENKFESVFNIIISIIDSDFTHINTKNSLIVVY